LAAFFSPTIHDTGTFQYSHFKETRGRRRILTLPLRGTNETRAIQRYSPVNKAISGSFAKTSLLEFSKVAWAWKCRLYTDHSMQALACRAAMA
jgi:hypothetical protein